jgi:cytochrome b involved in lipid metabolism
MQRNRLIKRKTIKRHQNTGVVDEKLQPREQKEDDNFLTSSNSSSENSDNQIDDIEEKNNSLQKKRAKTRQNVEKRKIENSVSSMKIEKEKIMNIVVVTPTVAGSGDADNIENHSNQNQNDSQKEEQEQRQKQQRNVHKREKERKLNKAPKELYDDKGNQKEETEPMKNLNYKEPLHQTEQELLNSLEKVDKRKITQKFTREEVSKHTKPNDVWIIVNGSVYDVSRYFYLHPGGQRALLKFAGRDASENVQYHSWRMMWLLDHYFYIGKVAGEDSGNCHVM